MPGYGSQQKVRNNFIIAHACDIRAKTLNMIQTYAYARLDIQYAPLKASPLRCFKVCFVVMHKGNALVEVLWRRRYKEAIAITEIMYYINEHFHLKSWNIYIFWNHISFQIAHKTRYTTWYAKYCLIARVQTLHIEETHVVCIGICTYMYIYICIQWIFLESNRTNPCVMLLAYWCHRWQKSSVRSYIMKSNEWTQEPLRRDVIHEYVAIAAVLSD